jgi:hypothetical protein
MNIYYFIDGVYSSFVFSYYISCKYSKERVIEQTNDIFVLPFLERIMFYTLLNNLIPIQFGFIFLFPQIQNKLFEIIYPIYYKEKWRCIKFIMSKRILWGLQKIHPVKNYYVFEIYKTIDYNFFCEFLNNLFTIFVAHTFKTSPTTYLYYTVLKYHSYFSNSYSFTISNYRDATDHIHQLIVDHDWDRLNNIDTLHAFFVIIKSKFTILSDDNILTRITFSYFEFFGFYYFLIVFKTIPLYFQFIILYIIRSKGFYIEHFFVSSFVSDEMISIMVIYFYKLFKVFFYDAKFYFKSKKYIDRMIKKKKENLSLRLKEK